MTKRIGIEAVRSLAVVSVVLYHLNPELFPNGYLGVDAFFVVSGFLVSGMLETQSIMQFFMRRFMRLAPAALTITLLVVILSTVIDPPYITKDIGQAALSQAVYATNILYYFKLDYFNPFHEQSPLRHLWSLSLEEQFYLVLPIVFALFRARLLRIIVGILGLLSLVLYLTESDQLYAFYMPHMRAWQLILGVILFQLKLNFGPSRWAPLALIPMGFALLSSAPVPLALPVTLVSTCFLVLSNWDQKNWGIVTAIGALSYSIYLVHQPIVYYVQTYLGSTSMTTFLILGATALGAWALHQWIEEPLRRNFRRRALLLVFGLTAVTALFGAYLHFTDGGWPIKQLVYRLPEHDSNQRDQLFDQRIQRCDALKNAPVTMKRVVLIGDSKAEDLRMAINSATGLTPYLFDVKSWNYHPDLLQNQQLRERMSNSEAEAVVLSNTWTRMDESKLESFIQGIHELAPHLKIYVLSTANFRDVSAQYYMLTRQHKDSLAIQRALIQNRPSKLIVQSDQVRVRLKKMSVPVIWIDKELAFHRSNPERITLLHQGHLMIYDSGHLTLKGAAHFGNWICGQIPEFEGN